MAVGAARRVVEQLAQTRLVGVQQVLGDGVMRVLRIHLPRTQALHGDRRVGARASEARGGAEIAQEQPAARRGGVAAVDGGQRGGVRASEDRRAGRAAGARQPGPVVAGGGPPGSGERAYDRLVGRRIRLADAFVVKKI